MMQRALTGHLTDSPSDGLGADEAADDDAWLRRRNIRDLQRLTEPGICGDAEHSFDVARARRILRRWGIEPKSQSTPFEKIAAKAYIRVPVLGRISGEIRGDGAAETGGERPSQIASLPESE